MSTAIMIRNEGLLSLVISNSYKKSGHPIFPLSKKMIANKQL